MKTFDELTAAQQDDAIGKVANNLLADIAEGAIWFYDTLKGDGLQARIDRAIALAVKKKTPWFASEYIMDTCKDDIFGMARSAAEDALYSEKNETIVHGIA